MKKKRKDLTVSADKGYFSGKDIKDTQEAGMTPLVPKVDTSGIQEKAYLIVHCSNTAKIKTYLFAPTIKY